MCLLIFKTSDLSRGSDTFICSICREEVIHAMLPYMWRGSSCADFIPHILSSWGGAKFIMITRWILISLVLRDGSVSSVLYEAGLYLLWFSEAGLVRGGGPGPTCLSDWHLLELNLNYLYSTTGMELITLWLGLSFVSDFEPDHHLDFYSPNWKMTRGSFSSLG